MLGPTTAMPRVSIVCQLTVKSSRCSSERVRTYQQAAAEQVEKLRTQLSRAEDFATTLTARLNRTAPPAGTQPDDDTP